MRSCAETYASELSAAELEALLSLVERKRLSGTHLEIGTAAGGTLCQLLQAYGSRKKPRFVAIDPMRYFPDQERVIRHNLERHGIDPSSVELRCTTSADGYTTAQARGEEFSFILIDASHKIRYVMQDLRWGELLQEGGYMCIHDYSSSFPDVQLAVDRFLRRNRHFRVVDHVESLLILRRMSRAPSRVGKRDRLFAWAASPLLQLRRSLRKRRLHRNNGDQ